VSSSMRSRSRATQRDEGGGDARPAGGGRCKSSTGVAATLRLPCPRANRAWGTRWRESDHGAAARGAGYLGDESADVRCPSNSAYTSSVSKSCPGEDVRAAGYKPRTKGKANGSGGRGGNALETKIRSVIVRVCKQAGTGNAPEGRCAAAVSEGWRGTTSVPRWTATI
jgi:hypothetical protein